MKKGKHTEAEIIKAVKETENGVSIEAVCRSHGIARGTLYNWRVKYGGMVEEFFEKEKPGMYFWQRLRWVVLSLTRMRWLILCTTI